MAGENILQIPITKGKGLIAVNTNDPQDPTEPGDLTPAVYREALIQGLKVIMNRGMTKLTKESFKGDEDALAAAAMKKANQTLGEMREDKIRFTGEKAATKKISGEVMTEARKIARNYVKAGLKKSGIKIAHVDAKEITRAANEMIAENPEIVDEAKAVVAARNAAAEGKGETKIDVTKFAKTIAINPKKKQKDDAEKAERKAASSAAKAGKVQVRAKPTGQGSHATH